MISNSGDIPKPYFTHLAMCFHVMVVWKMGKISSALDTLVIEK